MQNRKKLQIYGPIMYVYCKYVVHKSRVIFVGVVCRKLLRNYKYKRLVDTQYRFK